MLLQLIELCPDIFFESPAFVTAFRSAMAGLTVIHTEVVFASLTLFRNILTHDSLSAHPATAPPKWPVYASAIHTAFSNEGYDLIGYLLSGLVGDFPEDATSSVVSIFRAMSVVWGQELLSSLPVILQQLPTATVPNQAKADFTQDITKYDQYFIAI
jgi:transportin-3